uniref:Protein kinase domain-containing protein n=1 Tax=Mesocestoides corti TaxID=53468 RepID=A0A5K3FVL6_MESCO
MMNGKPPFQGSDSASQAKEIFKILGIPPPSYWPDLRLNTVFQSILPDLESDCGNGTSNSIVYDVRIPLRNRFTNLINKHWLNKPDAFDLLEACLQPYGPKRISAMGALQTDFLEKRVFQINKIVPEPMICQKNLDKENDYLTKGFQPSAGAVEYFNTRVYSKNVSSSDFPTLSLDEDESKNRSKKNLNCARMNPLKSTNMDGISNKNADMRFAIASQQSFANSAWSQASSSQGINDTASRCPNGNRDSEEEDPYSEPVDSPSEVCNDDYNKNMPFKLVPRELPPKPRPANASPSTSSKPEVGESVTPTPTNQPSERNIGGFRRIPQVRKQKTFDVSHTEGPYSDSTDMQSTNSA